MFHYRHLLLGIGFAVVTASAYADDAPFITERPGFSTSPQTLPKGRFQFEGGLDFNPQGDTLSAPVSLGRLGVSQNVELQIGWGGVSFLPGSNAVNDVFMNAKVAVTQQRGAIPNFGVIIGITLPLDGGQGLSNTQTSIGALWSFDVDHGFGVFGTATAVTQEIASVRDWRASNAIGLTKALPNDVGAFIELFSSFDDQAGDAHVVDFGLTYLLRPQLQLDISGGVGVSGPNTFDFISIGVSTRW